MTLHVLVAGAAGALGREVTRELLARGHRVRALVHRSLLPADLEHRVEVQRGDALEEGGLEGACHELDAVFSCLGASVDPQAFWERRTFSRVDTPANLNLIARAQEAGVGRFVYVSVAGHDRLGHLAYVQAHEAVVEGLRASGLSHGVIRPTGFFSAFGEFVQMAEKGPVPIIGDGRARTNPIHDRDLAVVCADAVESEGGEQSVGGPEVLTRLEIVERAFLALGKTPRTRSIPPAVMRGMASLMHPVNPRISDFLRFVVEVFTDDLVVPSHGHRTLDEYYAGLTA